MADEPEYDLEMLREGADFTLYRGMERGKQMPVLAVAVAAEQPSPRSLRRLEREFSLANEVDAAWAARPYALVRHEGRPMLILMDPGGKPLDQVIEQEEGHPMGVTRFLRIAIGFAAALGQAHRRGLIHKDVKPANALVDDSGRVWLTGLGIASRTPRDRQLPEAAEFIAGSLPYVAPEQTGRMNRSIDSRSDLYSLGITLYEMSTGRLPFIASDPMEWVHCQIARQPVSPHVRAPNLPVPVSAIIMKLLAKTAEDRYQTAAGLVRDLERCLKECEAHGWIDEFPLGLQDKPDRLLIPEKLYGRASETDALLASFDRVVAGGRSELVLVSGYSGVGKSSVVNELHKVLVLPRGLFAGGKADQYKQDIPYVALAQAFQMLVRQILVKSEAEVSHWRRVLLDAVGANGQLIINLIPHVEFVIGKQSPVAKLPGREDRDRFQLVFRRFLTAFATAEHPLALFLDDLQWLDTATLELLESLFSDADVRHVLLIGAYRDNEVSSSHALMRVLAAIRDAGARVHEMVLSPLSLHDVGRLIADSLRCERTSAAPLARLIYEKTGGNPFFTIHFVLALAEEGLLRFDRDTSEWVWDLGRIRAKGYSDNVVDLMVSKLRRFSNTTQAALQQLACLGSRAEVATLSMVFGQSEEEIHTANLEATRTGLVFRMHGSYIFPHDRIQEAAYALIAQSERPAAHLHIGRRLLAHLSPERRDGVLFDIVSQFSRSASVDISPEERAQVAELNLLAGRRAQSATAYASALSYFAEGCALLENDCWTRQYALTFELEFHRAECEFLTKELAGAEERLSMLARRAANPVDQAVVACLRMDLYFLLLRPERAVNIGLNYLQHVGLEVSLHPTDDAVRQEYERIWQRLGTRQIEELIDLPLMEDASKRATIDVLNKLMLSALYQDQRLHQLLPAHMVNFSIEHGNSAASCVAYAWLGRVLGSDFGDYSSALRFGQLSLDLVDKRGLDAFKTRVYFIFGTGISPLVQHLRHGRTFLQRASREGNKNVDLPYIGFCHSNIVGNLISSGEPLPEVDRAAMEGLDFAHRTGSGLIIAYIVGQLRLIRSLRGQPCDFNSFDGEPFDAERFERRLSADSSLATAADIYWSRRIQALVFEEEYARAVDVAALRHFLPWVPSPNIERAEYHFYVALARAGYRGVAGFARAEPMGADLETLKAHHQQLLIWAKHCPENLESRAALVGAEIARIEGRDVDAMRLYEQAIRSARANGFVQNEAMANELAARFYFARGIEVAGHAHLSDARSCYDRWGAAGKVRRLDQQYPRLRQEQTLASAATTGPSPRQLDVEAVLKASQAISSEIVLPKLIETLVRIAVEHAGAARGLLILVRDGEARIEAEAVTGQGRIEIVVRQSAVTPSDLLQSALHYVMRTQTHVLLDDASTDSVYSKDDYVRGKLSRSILCLPIVKQKEIVGALYLENNLAPFVFTPDRVAVLQMLASQAAISLENATLYTDLQLQVGLLQHLPVSAWTLNPDGKPDFVNQVWLEFAGQTSDFVQSHPEAWMTAVHPEDREMAAKIFWESVQSGRGFAIETRSLREQDGTYRWHLQQAVVLRDADGQVLKFVGTTTDIDDQKRAEEGLRQAQGDLARINRVTTMGELAASLAHEISQPITGVITNGNIALRELGRDISDLNKVKDAATRIVRDGQRAAQILSRIRSQFQKGKLDRELLDVNQITQEIIALLRHEATRYNISVRTELAADLPPIIGDRVQLQQVAMNLIVNSIDAMKSVEGMREMVIQSHVADDEQILVSIRDTGTGIPAHLMEQIFDPFFTTKAHGTGMGLRISRSIMESHGGRLWADASSAGGATFHLSLPVATLGERERPSLLPETE